MRQFNEERPTFATKVTWRFFPSKVSADWTQAAWRNGDDGLRVLRGESTASGLWFSVTNQTNEAVQNDMILPEIAIALEHTPERATDGRYLRLALQAACETAGYRVVWADHEDAQLLVWLSPETIPANWQVQVDQGAWVIADAEGSMRATRGNHVVFEDGNRVAVHHRSAPLNRGEMGLRDAFGSPLLERQGRFFQFHSRFEPDHWPIVLEGSFPLFLGGLLDRAFAPVPMNYSDRRVLPAGQSVTRNGSTQINRREANHASWQLPVFFLLCFCFAAERFLSERSAP